MEKHARGLGRAVAVVLALSGAGLLAHSRSQTPSEALAAEVRALRADVQENTAATVRAQLLAARLQLQEGRINQISWQIAELHRQIQALEERKATPAASLKRAEEGIAAGLQGFDLAVANARAELAALENEQRVARTQQALVQEQLHEEQKRWTAFSARLDELERTLPAVQRKP